MVAGSSTVTKSQGTDEASSTLALGVRAGEATRVNNGSGGTMKPDMNSAVSFWTTQSLRDIEGDLRRHTALAHTVCGASRWAKAAMAAIDTRHFIGPKFIPKGKEEAFPKPFRSRRRLCHGHWG